MSVARNSVEDGARRGGIADIPGETCFGGDGACVQWWAMRDGTPGKCGSPGNEESATCRFQGALVGSNPTSPPCEIRKALHTWRVPPSLALTTAETLDPTSASLHDMRGRFLSACAARNRQQGTGHCCAHTASCNGPARARSERRELPGSPAYNGTELARLGSANIGRVMEAQAASN